MKLYDDIDSGVIPLTRKVCRVLFLTLEHEAMHAETLLYMLIQRAGTGTIPPSGFTVPHWKALATAWNEAPVPDNDTVVLGPETITLGHDDPEVQDLQHSGDDALNHEYGWDNEGPKRVVEVEKFRISWRPVTNGEFYSFYTGEGKGKVECPASWFQEGGAMKVSYLFR
jgi:formylglycine-generating enzyme required for sulfatase activity